MKTLLLSAISLLLFHEASAQGKKPVTQVQQRPATATMQAVQTPAMVSPGKIDDTIPRHMYRYYKVDKDRYTRYINTNLKDSVKLLKANAKDWADFDAANNKLQQTLKSNPYKNVTNYISQDSDFKSIELIDKNFQTNTAKVCLRQLIFNIKLSDALLNKPLTDKTDLQLLSMSITNIDTLCLAYIVPFVNKTMSLMVYPDVTFKIFDKTGAELKTAACYLVSPHTCRSYACSLCKEIAAPCETGIVSNIFTQHNYFFECATPFVSKLADGYYHMFFIKDNKIIGYYYFGTSDYKLNRGEGNTVSLYLQ